MAVIMKSNSSLFLNYSELDRKEEINRLQQNEWDILVIGGGITGAGIAQEASLRGLSVALLDKYDFAFGTSSGSSKLGHGGIRYLKSREFGLVREATTERNWLRDKALPHMIRPLQFVYPIFNERQIQRRTLPKSSESLRKIRLAAFLYDFLCGFKNYAKREVIKDPKYLKELEPTFDVTGLEGAVLYYDTNLDDGRLTIETIWNSLNTGKVCAVNYLEVINFTWDDNEKINGVIAIENTDTGEEVQIRAKAVVNATGVWTDQILEIGRMSKEQLIRPTKGVHFAVPRENLPVNRAFGIKSLDDGRFFFVLPRNEWVLIGTTDTDFKGEPEDCYCKLEDVEYLRKTVTVLFPEAKITDDDILGSYAALRPLVAEPGKPESQVSRQHLILERSDGLFTIVGGKLTTFRKMAEDLLLKHLKPRTKKNFPKFNTKKGFSKIVYTISMTKEEWEALEEVKESNLDPFILKHLFEQYGHGAQIILKSVNEQSDYSQRLLEEVPLEVAPWIKGEIVYITKRECPVHLDDVLCRRMEIAWLVCPEHQRTVAERTTEIMSDILEWSDDRSNEEIVNYLKTIKKNSFFYEPKL